MSNNKDIINKIETNPTIIRYRKLEEVINKSNELNTQIEELKTLQKEIVHAKEYQKEKYLSKLESEYQAKLENVQKHPIMAEYMDLQKKINDSLKTFTDIIEKGINGDLTSKIDK